jgi:hypothetical protein
LGGGSNSAPPSDVAPGGGTYPTDIFGTAYNPQWNGGDYYGINQGFQQLGGSIAQGSQPRNFITQSAGITQQNPTYPSTPAGLIPTSYGTDVMSVLQRLLQGYQ